MSPVDSPTAPSSDGIVASQGGYIDGSCYIVNLFQKNGNIIGSASAVSSNNGSNTIIDIIISSGPFKYPSFNVCMHVYKTWRNNHVLGINRFCIGILGSQSLFNGNNPVSFHAYISTVPAVARSINNTTIGDDEVGGLLGKQNCRQEK